MLLLGSSLSIIGLVIGSLRFAAIGGAIIVLGLVENYFVGAHRKHGVLESAIGRLDARVRSWLPQRQPRRPAGVAVHVAADAVVRKDATYATVSELRDAAVAAGYQCPNWVELDQVANAAESGACTDKDVFCIYASQSNRDAQVKQTTANNEAWRKQGMPSAVVLFGPNWSISVADPRVAERLAAALGGFITS